MKKLHRYYTFLLFFISTHFIQSQNLTISTTGQTGTSGTNWSITGNTLTATGTADINASVINNHLATNALTVRASGVMFNADIFSTTANSLSILSNTFITNSSATTITTNGGSILFASNVDDATDGESTTNGYIQLRYGITINTSGGNITFGGGNTSGSEYSLGSSNQAYTEGVRFDTSIALNSGGGNITLRGKSYAMNVQEGWGASGVGFYFFSGAIGTINSGTGTITIDGYSQTNISSYASGIYSMDNMTITSANTTANAIRLIGKATGSSGDAYGIETENIFSVIATGTGGGITISSSTQNADTNDAVFRGETNILAKSGAIQLLGKQDGGAANGNWYISNNFYLGSKSSTSVSTSSSNITIQYDKYSFSGFTPKIATSGTLKLQPASASFGANVYTSWFSWNQNNQTMSGLTIGKSGNTASSVVLDSQLSVAGPIAAYGGTIYLYNNLTTTNAGAVSFYSDNAIVFDALRTVTAAGSFNYIPQSTFFVAAVTYPITNLTLSSAGLLIGNTTNTANITFDSATTTAGPITAYGGAINLNANLSSTATNADILLKATTNINQAAATTVTTTGGVVNFWADSDDNSTGYVQLLANATINSNGGNINLGGGSSLATDFAFGTAAETCPEASPNTQYISGVHMRSGSNLNSSGGNISIRGTNANISNAAMSFGVSFRGNTINSGSGKIAINGVARGSSSANAQGVTNWGLLTLRSSNTTSDAISIIGDASATVNSLSSLGINLSTLMEATGAGGGISISGKSGTETGGNASVNISGNILAVSGPITLSGDNSIGIKNNINFVNTTVIGKKTGTNVTASTSNVILEGNVIVFPATVSVDCSGTFTVRSFGNTFPSALSWPMTNVSLASSISGLTIGKTTNSANVTFANATTIAGPITAYGGVIALSANLTTTNNGDISLYTDNALGGLTTTARTITAAGSFNYIPRSDFFSAPVTYPITNLNLTSSGLLIGKSTNTAAITFANATTVAGPITAYGGTITLDANLTTTNNGAISLYTDNALGGLSTARTLTAAGAFKYIPRTTTFSADVTYPITNLTATSTGLT
ncbi:MAG: beta strand repeat-containing protein, partial [Flavobacterium psychrophilum]